MRLKITSWLVHLFWYHKLGQTSSVVCGIMLPWLKEKFKLMFFQTTLDKTYQLCQWNLQQYPMQWFRRWNLPQSPKEQFITSIPFSQTLWQALWFCFLLALISVLIIFLQYSYSTKNPLPTFTHIYPLPSLPVRSCHSIAINVSNVIPCFILLTSQLVT